MKWTKEQKSAIESREDKNILLAAAAGSGKTAVLVKRIIEKIKDKENPVSISDLLVLTFTEAAASEMKRKILSAIRLELEKNPENEHLKEQTLLIHSASISTVHAFCNKILKGNIHMTDLPQDYSLAKENDAKLLLKQAIDKTLEKYYSRIKLLPSFEELLLAYGGVKDDFSLRKLLTEIYLFSKSLPYPNEWLKKSVFTYKTIALENKDENTVWYDMKKAQEDTFISDILSCYEEILKVLKTLPEDHKYPPFYEAEADLVRETLDRYKNGEKSAVTSFKLPAKVRKQNICPTEEQMADNLRALAKDIIDEFKEFAASDTTESRELSEKLYKRAKTLKNIILMIDRAYTRLKRERGLLDFSDLEHELLKLLSDNDHSPTNTALELRKRYTEILLDEYQDTNSIQEEIFRLLSRDERNIFMVGDLKQCIYKFRNAAPELFAEKRKRYMENTEAGKLLSLSKNFRSRSEVIDTVNYLFSLLMTEDLGDIDYDEGEFLSLGADYPASSSERDFETEYFIIPDEEDSDQKEAEARFIAGHIEEIINDGLLVYDAGLGAKRKAEYRDIVVLLRHRQSASLIESALEERGIPAYSDSERGYLDSPEIGIVLSFLNIIDNPYQDIPLIAVLRSKMFGFTPDELAEIRLKKKNCWFYDALLASAEDGFLKAQDFIDKLDILRKEAETSTIYKLILTIYERFNLPSLMGLLKNPSLRRANLKLFAQRASEFERTRGGGLFNFMHYLESIKADGKDLSSAKASSESENVVRIMTIHKSKGLEFPIVFLADTSHKFNIKDLSRSINFHQEAGICLSAVDTKMRIKYPSSPSSIFKSILKRELLSEEMRLLYVALTRAKEKLIITSCLNLSAKKKTSPVYSSVKKPLGGYLKRRLTFSEWILSGFLLHPAARELRELFGFDEDMVSQKADFKLKVAIADTIFTTDTAEKIAENTPQLQAEDNTDFSEIISYTPPASGKIPVKITVSELKRRLSEDYEYTPRLVQSKNIYLKKKEELSAAEKGTITHFVLQHINEKDINSLEDVEKSLEKAEFEGVISKAQRSVVDAKKLMSFFESELGCRLKESVKTHKEYSFYTKITAGEIFDDLDEAEKNTEILLQGTIDCFFEEKDGKIILLDYKTDNIKEDEADERAKQYKIQIDCYNKALKSIFEKKTDESYIYFLNCQKAVKLD